MSKTIEATTATTEAAPKRGRKAGTVMIPNSVVKAFLLRTNDKLALLDKMGEDIDALVVLMAPTVKTSEEFKSSEEFHNVRRFKVAEAMTGWDATMTEDYALSIVAVAPRELLVKMAEAITAKLN